MPEASVHEDGDATLAENYVRGRSKIGDGTTVNPESKSEPVKFGAQSDLRSGVPAPIGAHCRRCCRRGRFRSRLAGQFCSVPA